MPNAQSVGSSHVQPRKLFYRINEVAKITGLKAHVLRYWESEFTELSPEKDASDQRRYRRKDIEVIRAIQKLLYEDRFTIKGARKRLRQEMRRPSASERAKKNSSAASEESSAPRVSQAEIQFPFSKAATHAQMPLGETLYHLRREVSDLLKLLGA